ncbi:hypothetical protein E6H31_01755 [Candidatus Bathyarchaeota archaeon]|nr:MAG: hypothetical protein E6H31_01755 [Candidatus Bathyarchaeota archaeon]
MLFARRQYLRAARLVALIISLVLLEVVYPAPPVHASGAGPFLIQTNGFGFPNPGPANNYFIQDKFGRLGYFSFDTSPSSGPDFYYSNNDGMTWTRDTSGVTTALLGDNDIGRGLFSSDGNFLIALRNTAPSSIAAISRFTVNRDVNNNIVSFVNTGNTDIVTGFVVNAGSALALNPDSSNAVIIGMSSVAAPNRNCFLQATISLAGYSNMAGIPNMIDCQTLDQNTQPILAIHPTSNAVMETGVDDFAPGGCGNGCGANYMLTIPHSGSGTNTVALHVSGNTAWFVYYNRVNGTTPLLGTIHLATVSGTGVVTDVTTLDCTVACGNGSNVDGGLSIVTVSAGHSARFVFTAKGANAGGNNTKPVMLDTITLSSGPVRTYVFYITTWSSGQNDQVSAFYWDGSSRSSQIYLENTPAWLGLDNQWNMAGAIDSPLNGIVYNLSNSATISACTQGPCRQLSQSAGAPDTSTQQSIPRGNGVINMLIKPDATNSATGTPSTSTPAGSGWVYDTDLAGKGIWSGAWKFDITSSISTPNRSPTVNLWVTVWSCTTDHFTGCMFLFKNWDNTTNIAGSASATKYTFTTNTPPFFPGVHYFSIEYWIHATQKSAATLTQTTNDASSDVVIPYLANVVSFVGSAANSGGTTIAVTYTSSGGHFIFVSIIRSFACSVSSVTDTGGSTYSLLKSINSGGGGGNGLEIWGTSGIGSIASTSFSITTTNCGGFNSAVAVAEYAGAVSTLGQVAANSGTGLNQTPSLTINLITATDWLVTGMNVVNGNASCGQNSGIVRASDSSPVGVGCVIDNTANGATSVITSVNIGTSAQTPWVAAGVELQVSQ